MSLAQYHILVPLVDYIKILILHVLKVYIFLGLKWHELIEVWLLRHHFFFHKSVKRSLLISGLRGLIHRGCYLIEDFLHVDHTSVPLLVLLGWLDRFCDLCPLDKCFDFCLNVRAARWIWRLRRLRFAGWVRIFRFIGVANHFLTALIISRVTWNLSNCLVFECTCLGLWYYFNCRLNSYCLRLCSRSRFYNHFWGKRLYHFWGLFLWLNIIRQFLSFIVLWLLGLGLDRLASELYK